MEKIRNVFIPFFFFYWCSLFIFYTSCCGTYSVLFLLSFYVSPKYLFWSVYFIYAYISLNHSSFESLHLFLMFLLNIFCHSLPLSDVYFSIVWEFYFHCSLFLVSFIYIGHAFYVVGKYFSSKNFSLKPLILCNTKHRKGENSFHFHFEFSPLLSSYVFLFYTLAW